MPSDRSRAPGQYLPRLLGSGAPPFLYRGGVYRLLGTPPPDPGRVGFLPALPPVGFQYAHVRSAGMLEPAPRPPASPPGTRANEHDQDLGGRAPARMPVPAAPRPSGLAIPGITERRLVFAALAGQIPPASAAAAAEAPSAPRPAAVTVPEGVASEQHLTPSPPPSAARIAGARHGGLARPDAADEGGTDPRRTPGAAMAAAGPGPVPRSTQPVEAPGRPTPGHPGGPPRNAAPAAARTPGHPGGPPRDAAPAAARTPGLAAPHAGRSASVGAQPPAPPRTRAAVIDRVEQLRQAVAQLTVRQSPSRVEPPPIAAPPPPPVPTVTREVIVVQAPPRAGRGGPRSVLASSTLRSAHLGVLR